MSDYVKTEWQTGDIITAEKLNNIEDGIANAGGGSSLFTTAILNIAKGDDVLDTVNMALPVIYDDELSVIMVNGSYPVQYEIPLYNGEIWLYCETASVKAYTGNATYDSDTGMFHITGDSTLTLNYTGIM